MRIFSHNARNNDRVTGMFDRYLGQNLRENDADDALQQLSSRWVFDDSNRRDYQRVRAVESTRAAHKVAILRRLGAAQSAQRGRLFLHASGRRVRGTERLEEEGD